MGRHGRKRLSWRDRRRIRRDAADAAEIEAIKRLLSQAQIRTERSTATAVDLPKIRDFPEGG